MLQHIQEHIEIARERLLYRECLGHQAGQPPVAAGGQQLVEGLYIHGPINGEPTFWCLTLMYRSKLMPGALTGLLNRRDQFAIAA